MKILLICSYVLFLLVFDFFSYLFVDVNLSSFERLYSGFTFSHRLETSIAYSFFVTIFFVFYLIILRLFKQSKLSHKDIKLILIITSLILFFSYPAMLSFDIFNYLLTAKVSFFYHENPYVIMPIQFINDPLLSFAHGANKIALYGPSWIILTGIPYLLGFGNFILTLFNFKLVVAAFYLATLWIIHRITKDFTSVLIFALNPLVIIETLLSGHNDVVMMFFALLSIYFMSKEKIIPAFIFLLASFFIKYSTLFLLPVFIYVVFAEIKKRSIVWDKVYLASVLLMFFAFILSPIREEMYPWYAIWFLSFTALLPKNKIIFYLSVSLSFSLLLRYVPFMLLGTYFGPTPAIKIITTATPVIGTIIYLLIRKKYG